MENISLDKMVELDVALKAASNKILGIIVAKDLAISLDLVEPLTQGEQVVIDGILAEASVEKTYKDFRKEHYPTIDEMVVALFESVVEDRPESAISLQEKRLAVKVLFAKPE